VLTAARAAIARHGDEKFKAWLNESGAGNSPELAKFLAGIKEK
jgi:hypothetical protein